MIDREQLCALALAAIDDDDARVVLADAIEESGWCDDRAVMFVHGVTWRSVDPPFDSTWFAETLKPGPGLVGESTLTRAIAAVLLFGLWPTSWTLAERCRREFGDVFPVFPRSSLHDVVEQCIPCPEGQLQRISTANDGLFNDDVRIRVERWPDGDRSIGARHLVAETRISHVAIARSNDVAGILLHECRQLDRVLRDGADKGRRT